MKEDNERRLGAIAEEICLLHGVIDDKNITDEAFRFAAKLVFNQSGIRSLSMKDLDSRRFYADLRFLKNVIDRLLIWEKKP